MKPTIKYKVYAIERGLLVEPESWGSNVFSTYGYNTQDEALAAVEQANYKSDGLVILPVTFWVHHNEEDE